MSLRACAAYVVIAVADYAYQRHTHDKQLKMTKEEVKQEYKNQEMSAEVRGARKRRQMESARARMMDAVPEADVIVTNPTHFSVALKYEAGNAAPIVVAKGQDILALRIREKTGFILEYALSFTVTRRNIDDVPEVIRWYLADPQRSYIWRMLSFQPEADTGRTIFSQRPITSADVWQKICDGVGLPLRRDVSIFGHPDCNSWASLLIARPSGKYFPLLPDDPKFDALFGEVLAKIGGLSLVNDDAGTPAYRLAGIVFKNPVLIARVATRLFRYLTSRNAPREIFQSLLRGQVHTLGVGMHNFMDAAQVAKAPDDPVIKARLDSCVFKGAVKRNGEWQAVPMCSMNQQTWSEVYDGRLQDPELLKQPQVYAPAAAEPALPTAPTL